MAVAIAVVVFVAPFIVIIAPVRVAEGPWVVQPAKLASVVVVVTA